MTPYEKNELYHRIREIIELNDSLVAFPHGNESCILPEHYDEMAKEIVEFLTKNCFVSWDNPLVSTLEMGS
jgi:hypothetical protein